MIEAKMKRLLNEASRLGCKKSPTKEDLLHLAIIDDELSKAIKIPYNTFLMHRTYTMLVTQFPRDLARPSVQQIFITASKIKLPTKPTTKPAVAPDKRSSMKPLRRKRRKT